MTPVCMFGLPLMPYDSDWQRQQRARWLRHDAHLWMRHDAARFVRPGFDPADVFPTLARKRDEARRRAEAAQAVEDAALAAEIEDWRRVQAAIQAELKMRSTPKWRAAARSPPNTARPSRACPQATRAAANGPTAAAAKAPRGASGRMPGRVTSRV